MANETENASNDKIKAEKQQVQIYTLLSLAATLDNETIVRAICEVMDIDYEEIKDRLPEDGEYQTKKAQEILDGVIPDEGGGIDESKTKGSAAGPS